jgi:hypothetical protein
MRKKLFQFDIISLYAILSAEKDICNAAGNTSCIRRILFAMRQEQYSKRYIGYQEPV